MYANNDAISIDHGPVHGYKMYKDKPPPSMLEPDSSFYLSVNYFKTETRASVEGKNWFKAQPVWVNKLRWYGTLIYGDFHEKFYFLKIQDLRSLNTCQKHFEMILPNFPLDECEIEGKYTVV